MIAILLLYFCSIARSEGCDLAGLDQLLFIYDLIRVMATLRSSKPDPIIVNINYDSVLPHESTAEHDVIARMNVGSKAILRFTF
jgi:hypothetical protein